MVDIQKAVKKAADVKGKDKKGKKVKGPAPAPVTFEDSVIFKFVAESLKFIQEAREMRSKEKMVLFMCFVALCLNLKN